MSEHKSWNELDRYTHGLLEGDERQAVEAHAHECAECRTALRALHREEETLRQALVPDVVDEDTIDRIIPKMRPKVLRYRRAALLPLVAAAALIVMVIAITRLGPTSRIEDPMVSTIAALAREEAGAESRVLRLGRKGLSELSRAEAASTGEERARLASARERVERSLPRILWVEAHPRNDFTMFASALREDHGWYAQTLVLETKACETSPWTLDVPFRTPVRSFPTHELEDYDVVILGSFRSADVALPVVMEEFVRVYGGGLLMIAGEKRDQIEEVCTTLAQVDPVAQPCRVPSRVRLTEAGRGHPALALGRSRDEFFAAVTPIRWYRTVRVRFGATVLLEAEDGTPLLVVAEPGRGRVAYLATDDHWIWGSEAQNRYYKAILSWLARDVP